MDESTYDRMDIHVKCMNLVVYENSQVTSRDQGLTALAIF
jgi:hypothetical protein